MRRLSSVINLAMIAVLCSVMLPLFGAGVHAQNTADRTLILGAGSTFAAPLYYAWIRSWTKNRPNVAMSYDAVGSGEGIKRFIAGSADFAGTDVPLTDKEFSKAQDRVLQIASTAGMIVLAYNLPGFKGELRLPRDLYPEILAGKVRYWDDPRIQSANPNVRLPHRWIVVAARLDSSGTTFALSRHLAEINRNWRDSGFGVGKLIDWRSAMLARGNEGVAQLISISEGAIGYVEYGFAARLGLPMAILENKAGKFIAPTDAAGKATMAAAGDDVPDDLRTYLADPEGDESYPIITLSWLALHEHYRNPAKAAALKEFIDWGLTEGQAFSTKLGYVPLPASLSDRSRQALSATN
jgi:phosphate transport system substrate-binding protein